MTESKQNSEQPGGDAGAANAALTADDLGLISDTLEDSTKTDEELFDEIGAEETAAENGEDLAGKPAVDANAAAAAGSVEDQLAAGIDAGKQPGGAPSDQDDKGKQESDDAAIAVAEQLWSGASEDQRDAFNAAQDQITKLEHLDRSQRGRVSTLQRQVNDITKQLDRAAKAPDDKLGAADAGKAATGFLVSKDWKNFEGEYPEVAGPIGHLIADLQEQVSSFKGRQDAIDDDRRLDAVEAQTDLLEKEHSDWLDAVTDDAFGPWLEDQPRHMREAAVRNAKEIVDASEAADVVGRFKAFRLEQSGGSAGPGDDGSKKPDGQEDLTGLSGKRKRQLEASSGTRPRGAGAAHGIPEEGDEEAIWDAFDKQEAREARQA